MLVFWKKFKNFASLISYAEDLVHTVGNPYANKLYSTLYFFKVGFSAVGLV